MTDKIILELTIDELKTLDKHIEYNEETKSVFDKIKYAYPQPKMTLDNEGEYVVVSYNDMTYYRLMGELSYFFCWYKRRGVSANHPIPTLVAVTDAETEQLLEGLYLNHIEVKKEKEPKDNEWKNVALEFGKKLPVILPYSYAELSPNAWYKWAIFVFDEYVKQRDIECGYARKYQEPQEPNTFTPKEIKELIKEGLEWCEDHPNENPLDYLTPKTPEQTAQSLKEAFVEAQKTEKWKEIQKLIDEEDNDKNFKNSLDLIKEWGEKNKPITLYQLIEDWWSDIFCANSMDDMETCIDGLVDKIEEFLPKEHDTNSYKWNECIKMIKSKLR